MLCRTIYPRTLYLDSFYSCTGVWILSAADSTISNALVVCIYISYLFLFLSLIIELVYNHCSNIFILMLHFIIILLPYYQYCSILSFICIYIAIISLVITSDYVYKFIIFSIAIRNFFNQLYISNSFIVFQLFVFLFISEFTLLKIDLYFRDSFLSYIITFLMYFIFIFLLSQDIIYVSVCIWFILSIHI